MEAASFSASHHFSAQFFSAVLCNIAAALPRNLFAVLAPEAFIITAIRLRAIGSCGPLQLWGPKYGTVRLYYVALSLNTLEWSTKRILTRRNSWFKTDHFDRSTMSQSDRLRTPKVTAYGVAMLTVNRRSTVIAKSTISKDIG